MFATTLKREREINYIFFFFLFFWLNSSALLCYYFGIGNRKNVMRRTRSCNLCWNNCGVNVTWMKIKYEYASTILTKSHSKCNLLHIFYRNTKFSDGVSWERWDVSASNHRILISLIIFCQVSSHLHVFSCPQKKKKINIISLLSMNCYDLFSVLSSRSDCLIIVLRCRIHCVH